MGGSKARIRRNQCQLVRTFCNMSETRSFIWTIPVGSDYQDFLQNVRRRVDRRVQSRTVGTNGQPVRRERRKSEPGPDPEALPPLHRPGPRRPRRPPVTKPPRGPRPDRKKPEAGEGICRRAGHEKRTWAYCTITLLTQHRNPCLLCRGLHTWSCFLWFISF